MLTAFDRLLRSSLAPFLRNSGALGRDLKVICQRILKHRIVAATFIFWISECGRHDWGSSHWSKVGSQMLRALDFDCSQGLSKSLEAHSHSFLRPFPIIYFAFRHHMRVVAHSDHYLFCPLHIQERIFAVKKSNPKWKHKNGLSPRQQKWGREDDLRSSVSPLLLCPFFCLFVYLFVCLQHVFVLQATASLPLPGHLTHLCTLAWWLQRTTSSGADDDICDDGVYVCLSPLVMMMVTIWWWPGGFRGQQAHENAWASKNCLAYMDLSKSRHGYL